MICMTGGFHLSALFQFEDYCSTPPYFETPKYRYSSDDDLDHHGLTHPAALVAL